MGFKINVANKGKTYKLEVENESLVGVSIGDKIDGGSLSEDLAGYELEITGTSDKAGFPGKLDENGPGLRKKLLGYGFGMKQRPRKEGKKQTPNTKGLKLRKTVRGKEISNATVQINTKVVKEGKKKFDELFAKPEENAEAPAPETTEEKKE